jgi:hypothetical protein
LLVACALAEARFRSASAEQIVQATQMKRVEGHAQVQGLVRRGLLISEDDGLHVGGMGRHEAGLATLDDLDQRRSAARRSASFSASRRYQR